MRIEHMNEACKYLLKTEARVSNDSLIAAAKIWHKFLDVNSQLYYSESSNSLLELNASNELNEKFSFGNQRATFLKDALLQMLKSDFRQEILLFKESVIEQKNLLPQGEYIQLRHIEVPLNMYEEYLNWRADTIFPYVKEICNIESFSAYHSYFSTMPGVMFISSFSCDPRNYVENFSTETYQEIIKQAGDRYIAGGKDGLYTKIYKQFQG